jgi:hypothetical protein
MSVHEKLDERDLRYFKFAFGRAQGWPDKRIVEELGDPDIDSPQALYRRLSQDDYPVCPECGMALVSANHCKPPKRQRNPGAGIGQRRQLPPAAEASDLFRERLEVLLREVDELEHQDEVLQDGRVAATGVYKANAAWVPRTGNSEEWRALCERYGQEPSTEGFWATDIFLKAPAGAARKPSEPVVTLIGVYALSGGDIDPLLKKLYPGTPSEETLKKIRDRVEGEKKPDNVDGLRTVAAQLATLVRGGTIEGAPPVPLTPEEHDAACFITQLREEGHSEDMILRRLSNHRRRNGKALTKKDVGVLGNLWLRYPRT